MSQEAFEKSVLEGIKRQPDFVRLPDGREVEWAWEFGRVKYTKSQIIANWKKDREMTQRILDRAMNLVAHLGRRER